MSNFNEDKKLKKRQIFAYLKILKPIILSHHPNCGKFENHVIKIGKYRLCIGCFIGYPTAFITISIINLLHLQEMLSSQLFVALGIILLSFFIISLVNLTKIKWVKILQKFLIGIGAGFLFWGLWKLPNSSIINFTLLYITFSVILGVLNGYHAYGFYRMCKKCEYSLNWRACPGFKNIYDEIEKESLKSKIKKR